MGVGGTYGDRKGSELCELSNEAGTDAANNKITADKAASFVNPNSKRNTTSNAGDLNSPAAGRGKKTKRRQQRKMAEVLPVQRLFQTCKEVFSSTGTGIVPSPQDILRVRAVLDEIKPDDVGLTPEMPYFRSAYTHRSSPPITYLHLHECDKFSMGIFCLPPSGVLPLHNHPGMTVFSKILFGTMHIKSYDWAADTPQQNLGAAGPVKVEDSGVQLAKLKVDSDFPAPCATSILYPADGGNMHCFTAVTACAVLDVLGPPYSDIDGRHCTYYLEFPFTKFSVDGLSIPNDEEKDSYAWLKERDNPEELSVVGALYRGPKIVKN